MPPLDSENTGALSVDEAASLFSQPEKKETQEQPEAEQPEVETEQEATETEQPVEAEGEAAETEQEGQESEEDKPEAQPEVEAPHWWNAESKDRFKTLPPELQAVVLEQEKNREAAVTKAQQAAAEVRKKFEAETAQITQIATAINELLPRAQQTFASKWERVDWKAWADTDPEAAFKGRLQMEAEHTELQQLQAAKHVAEQKQYQKFVAEEEEKLKTAAPDLVHPEKGKVLRTEVGKFLIERGATEQELRNVDARILSMAYDAYRWNQAQAKAQAQARSQPQAAPKLQPKTVVKPTASASSRSPNQARMETLNRKRSLTVDEAVELTLLKGK